MKTLTFFAILCIASILVVSAKKKDKKPKKDEGSGEEDNSEPGIPLEGSATAEPAMSERNLEEGSGFEPAEAATIEPPAA